MKSHTWAVIHSSANQCWRTPSELFNKLNEEFGFTLDAAAQEDSALLPSWFGPDHSDPARRDALSNRWRGVVWCNPPYGRTVGKWVEKAALEAELGSTVVMLVMANTDTTYFHDHALKAEEIRFIRGRVRFLRHDGTKANAAPKGSMLLIFKPHTNEGYPALTPFVY